MTSDNDLFSDQVLSTPADESSETQLADDSASWLVPVVTTLGLLLLVAAIGVLWYTRSRESSTTAFTISGKDVSALKPGSPVLLDKMQVGEVDSVSLRQGVPVAALKLKRDYVSEIPADSHFEVGSLNWILPGNIGVKIVPNEKPRPTASLGPPTVDIDEAILPLEVPTQSYILLAVLLLAASIAAGVTLKIARSAWVGKTILAVVVAFIVYLFLTGGLRVEQVQELLRTIPLPNATSPMNHLA